MTNSSLGNLHILKTLWTASRRRARGRTARQRKLWQNKSGKVSNTAAWWGTALMVIFAIIVHVLFGNLMVGQIQNANAVAQQSDTALMVLPKSYEMIFSEFSESFKSSEMIEDIDDAEIERMLDDPATVSFVNKMANFRRDVYGGRRQDHKDTVQQRIATQGSEGFVVLRLDDSLESTEQIEAAYWFYAGMIFLLWMLMLFCQGEGPDIDFTRRRHPHWEWLMSHPVRPALAFFGEFLAPIMTNPIYIAAPLFWFVIFNAVYPFLVAVCMAVFIGICFSVAASCLNKSIEIAATLRFTMSRRGVFLGITSLLGYVVMIIPLLLNRDNSLIAVILGWCASMPEQLPIQWFSRILLVGWSPQPVLWQSIFAALLVSTVIILAAGFITWWGTKHGLQATEPSAKVIAKNHNGSKPRWLKNAYFRKEMLWLRRDKGAVVQIVLIPLIVVGFQAVNFQPLLKAATGHWSTVSGLVIICGTYFLLVIGPRSLNSEGGALWIAQTWPTSLENLLKAKARLWFGFALCLVYVMLVFVAISFPEYWWKTLLVALAWPVFSWGLAHKSICLITAPSSSGEQERPPLSRQFAVSLGTFAFGGGVMMQSWHLAVVGVAFSLFTAAAMWQGLRVRLPYLFDAWSEPLPAPPTLMQVMIGIAIMVECVSGGSAIAASFGSPEQLWLYRAIGYAAVGAAAYLLMHDFLTTRGVSSRQIWIWHTHSNQPVLWAFIAAFAGVILSGIAWVYLEALRVIPLTYDYMAELDKLSAQFSSGIIWQLVLTVALVPIIEEYFFRGLLYRALDKELGGWKALISSSAFFAVYHPPVSWVPVFFLGLVAAWVFKLSGRLWPCVIIHMAYNFVVVLMWAY